MFFEIKDPVECFPVV